MKKKFSVMSLILALTILSTLLFSCTTAEPDSEAPADSVETSQDTSEEETIQDEKVSISIFTQHGPGHSDYELQQEVIAIFNEMYPDVELVDNSISNADAYYNKQKTDIATGNLSTLQYYSQIFAVKEYAKAGLVADVSPMFEDAEWYDGMIPSSLETWHFTDEGLDGYYGVPYSVQPDFFYYNLDLFEQAGIESTPTTVAEFYEVIDKLKAIGVTPFGLGGADSWRTQHVHNWFLYKWAGVQQAYDMGARTAKWTDPVVVESFAYLKDLKTRGAFAENFEGISYDQEKSDFFSGKSGMLLNGTWFMIDVLQSDMADNIGVFPLPNFEEKPEFNGNATVYPAGLHVAGGLSDAELEAAFNYIKIRTGVDIQTTVAEAGRLPVRSDLTLSNPHPLYLASLDILNAIEIPGGDSFDYDPVPSMLERVRNSVTGLMLTNTPEQTAQEIQDVIDNAE